MAHYAISQAHGDLQLHRNEIIGGKGLCSASFGPSIALAARAARGRGFICSLSFCRKSVRRRP